MLPSFSGDFSSQSTEKSYFFAPSDCEELEGAIEIETALETSGEDRRTPLKTEEIFNFVEDPDVQYDCNSPSSQGSTINVPDSEKSRINLLSGTEKNKILEKNKFFEINFNFLTVLASAIIPVKG